ncbi:hypothetical protein [Pedobacter segetis]|nr:hypothetical protein [Pedobacter segetis]
MRIDPKGTVKERNEANLIRFKRALAIVICAVLVYFFVFKIVFF